MTHTTSTKANRPHRMAREPHAAIVGCSGLDGKPSDASAETASFRPQTKAGLVEGLLIRDDGASLDELCQATGWLPHTCRAFLTGLRKKGRNLERAKREEGTTCYKLVPAEAAT
jgi:Protein of unknown function (DUF3489)